MNLDSILKYQSIDLELRKLKREMHKNEHFKIAEDMRRRLNEMKNGVEKRESVATKG